jgi:hypothetical protein
MSALQAEQAYTMTYATFQFKLEEVNEAMRRPGLLQRADELVPHTVARVLLAMAATVEDNGGFRSADSMQSRSAWPGWMCPRNTCNS